MKTPCATCPFRITPRFHLPAARVLEIGYTLTHDGSFDCHKNNKNPCIGAISVLDRQSDAMANICVRLAARCGALDYPIVHNVPVYASFEEAAIALSSRCSEADGGKKDQK